MDTGVMAPLALFAIVALIVGIMSLTKVRDKEVEVYQRLHLEEMNHQRRMKELESELERVRRG